MRETETGIDVKKITTTGWFYSGCDARAPPISNPDLTSAVSRFNIGPSLSSPQEPLDYSYARGIS